MELDNYRIVSSDNINELEEMMNRASSAGFKVVEFNDNKKTNNWQGIAIMERVVFETCEENEYVKNILKEVVTEGSAPLYITNKIKDLLNELSND